MGFAPGEPAYKVRNLPIRSWFPYHGIVNAVILYITDQARPDSGAASAAAGAARSGDEGAPRRRDGRGEIAKAEEGAYHFSHPYNNEGLSLTLKKSAVSLTSFYLY